MRKIRIAINGYGNLGKSAEIAARQFPDMALAAILTRRNPRSIQPATAGLPVYHLDQAASLTGMIDVMILCSGSMKDLPEQGPAMARLFHTVDGYDTHALIPEYFAAMDQAGRSAGKLNVIAAGWDPGLLSLQRLLSRAILPAGKDETFWGRGVSQGHSDAIRRIRGVVDARQYTIPREEAVEAVREGEDRELSTADKHERECYVVLEEGADAQAVAAAIKAMPHYFADYHTTVHFVSLAELKQNHAGLPHQGLMMRNGRTGRDQQHRQLYSVSLQLDSNPDFTAHVLLACARAAFRMAGEGQQGARTMLDIPPAYLSSLSSAELLSSIL